jgi:hypothetical protein
MQEQIFKMSLIIEDYRGRHWNGMTLYTAAEVNLQQNAV